MCDRNDYVRLPEDSDFPRERILVTGSRTINQLFNALENEISENDIVIHGGAVGVDSMTEEWCKERGIQTQVIRPLDNEKKHYYILRNAEMIGMCDRVVAIWDYKSKGTKFTIEYAQGRGKPVSIYGGGNGKE